MIAFTHGTVNKLDNAMHAQWPFPFKHGIRHLFTVSGLDLNDTTKHFNGVETEIEIK